MKRKRNLIVLLIALAVLSAAAFAANSLNSEQADTAEEDTGVSVFAAAADAVTELEWSYQEKTLRFTNTADDGWLYAGDESFPLDGSYISAALTALSDVVANKTIENAEDLAQYGLAEPVCTVTVTAEDSAVLLIGNETELGGERYLSVGDGKVYLVDAGLLDAFTYSLYDMAEKESIPDMADITSLAITSDTQNMELYHLEDSGLSYSDSYVWFLKDGEEYLTLDTELTDAFAESIIDLSWGDCVDHNAAGSLADYGLDTPAATVAVNYTDADGEEAAFILEIGNDIDSDCYARIAGSGMVYRIDAAVSDALLYTEYRDLQPDEVLLLDTDTLLGADVILDGETYHMEKNTKTSADDEGNVTEEVTYLLNDTAVEFETVLDTLTALTSAGYADEITPTRNAEISFIFYRDTETFKQVELTFYQYDSAMCLVTLNGTSTVFVNRSDVVSLVETVNTLVPG